MCFLFTEISTPNINYPGLIWDSSGGTVSHEYGLIFIMLVARLVITSVLWKVFSALHILH
jgi:hypothetical protein